MTEKITTDEFWDEEWANHPLPQKFKASYDQYYKTVIDEFYHKILPKNPNGELVELGCTPGRFMHYFHEEFGYKVTGLDNSPSGVAMTKKNLETLKVPNETYVGDVLTHDFHKQFDVVVSLGLVEHFNPPTEVVTKHYQALKNGGLMIIEVPNIFSPFYNLLLRLRDPKRIDYHVKVLPQDFQKMADDLKMKTLYCGYVGVFDLYLVAGHKISLFTRICQYAVDTFLRLFKIKKETAMFSPFIFYVGQKVE